MWWQNQYPPFSPPPYYPPPTNTGGGNPIREQIRALKAYDKVLKGLKKEEKKEEKKNSTGEAVMGAIQLFCMLSVLSIPVGITYLLLINKLLESLGIR